MRFAAAAAPGAASEVAVVVFVVVVAPVLVGTASASVPLCLQTFPLKTTFAFAVLVPEIALVGSVSAFETAFENSLQPAPFVAADSYQGGLELCPSVHLRVRWGRLGF